jgi:hypothetical protein
MAHLYHLRHHQRYRERRKPQPQGQPGFLRLHTVHQGDGPEGKGVYHINAVDEVTQWQIAGATPHIAAAIGDTDAARRMQQAKAKLFERLRLTA